MTLKMKLCDMPITAVEPGGNGPPARVSFCESRNQGPEINRKGERWRVTNKNNMPISRRKKQNYTEWGQKQGKGH